VIGERIYELQDQRDHVLRPPAGGGGNWGLEFSHALPVVVKRRRRREHPRFRESSSLVPAGPPILGDADTGAGGLRRGRSPEWLELNWFKKMTAENQIFSRRKVA
jgi:hypothetical protein